jgi:hypothetical protein
MGYKPYIPRLVHELKEDDFDRRVEYCETFLSLVQNEPDIIYRAMWLDEAIFRLNGHLTPTDFFLWGYLKDIVYKSKPRTLSDLKQSIISAFSSLDSDLCKKVCESVPERLQRCIDADGYQFEHLN